MNWILGGIAIALLIMGLVGQAFEMRKIRISTYRDEELASSKIFMNKKKFQMVCNDWRRNCNLVSS